MSGAAAGSLPDNLTEPRERGRRKAEFSVTPGFFSFSTPASMPEPKPRWNWMSGCARGRIGIPEAAGLEEAGGHRPFLEQQILQAGPGRAVELCVIVVGEVARAFGDDEEVEMVLQVLADAGQVVHRLDADRLQMIGRADAGEHQEFWRADGARADDDFSRGAQDFRLGAGLGDDLDAGAPCPSR